MTEALLPFEREGMLFAGGVRAGDWVFASEICGSARIDPKRPLSGEPAAYLEAKSMYARALDVLEAGGVDFGAVVRADQYFRDWRAVPFFHQARREACGNYIAPSTSVLEPIGPGMMMDLVATREKLVPVFPDGLDVPSTSSFVPVVKTGQFVFVAGLLAAHGEGDLGGVAPEAKIPEGHLWKGNRIQLEADYLVRKKLAPALEGAGCTLADVVKAQVYLADIADVPAFNQVWRRHFGATLPATTFVPTLVPGLAIADARCEINLVAYKGAATRVEQGVAPACDGHPLAVSAGDLLLLSGLMEQPAEAADEICRSAGASLANALRIQVFYTNEAEYYETCRALKRRVPGKPLPVCGVQVPGPLLIPGSAVQIDCWVFRGAP